MRDELTASYIVREVLKIYAATYGKRISVDGAHYAFKKLAEQMPKAFPCLDFSRNNYSPQLETILSHFSGLDFITMSGDDKECSINIDTEILLKQLPERKDDKGIQELIEIGKKFSEFLEEYAIIRAQN